jgi:hypothetical protein
MPFHIARRDASRSVLAGDRQPEVAPKRSSGIARLSLWHGPASSDCRRHRRRPANRLGASAPTAKHEPDACEQARRRSARAVGSSASPNDPRCLRADRTPCRARDRQASGIGSLPHSHVRGIGARRRPQPPSPAPLKHLEQAIDEGKKGHGECRRARGSRSRGRHAGDAACLGLAILQNRMRHIVRVATRLRLTPKLR